MMSLETLVKLIPYVIIILVLCAAIYALYEIFYAKQESTPAINDLDRAAAILKQLSPYDVSSVFTTTKGHDFILYAKDHPDLPAQCSAEACLCVIESGGMTTCRALPEVVKECKESMCEFEKMCFNPESLSASVSISRQGDMFYLCRGCTKIGMAESKEKCQQQI